MFPCVKAVGLNKATEVLKGLRTQQFTIGSGYDDDCDPRASVSEKAGETLSCFTLSWVTSDMSAALELLPSWLKPCLAQSGNNELVRVLLKGDEGAEHELASLLDAVIEKPVHVANDTTFFEESTSAPLLGRSRPPPS